MKKPPRWRACLTAATALSLYATALRTAWVHSSFAGDVARQEAVTGGGPAGTACDVALRKYASARVRALVGAESPFVANYSAAASSATEEYAAHGCPFAPYLVASVTSRAAAARRRDEGGLARAPSP